ncbi:MAG TPA: macro domain-containing protein [Candidatus Syntrophoarchaeum butanivorans]|uniref:Macro domain-containing protein n=1 Tax=Candidatus Syntropharchaeum butanivorans TaxID=1839936 RepID=A0A7C0X280_9EURY|nr:MAG: macro domain-containing protein [Candidatus Syntrophoarchaeum sp. WYZ-LMO15]HDM36474.1 macro domain-containing protein [Candidatus Syntrophoarchaeum butanivorans]
MGLDLKVKGRVLSIVKGDITECDLDAIVNAANTSLVMGGGVAGAIRRKGGESIQEECNKIGGIPVGGAAITGAGNLKAKYVIHAAGPRFGEGDEDEKLKNAVLNSLRLAEEHGIKSIAFPAISTGIFGFPLDRCAKIMINTIKEYLSGDTSIERVVIVLFDDEAYRIFSEELR